MSEIDDIFAFKGKAKATPAPLQDAPSLTRQKKKKKKKRQQEIEEHSSSSSRTEPVKVQAKMDRPSKKRRLPETVVDISHDVSVPTKRRKTDDVKKAKKKGEDLAAFTDSRGSSSRKTTDEGWLVYKEDELGIGETGGDTPLCPFDCDCCF